jgi:hypothetical protein
MDGLLICLGTVGTLVVIFGFILLMRYINYKETLALAEKGLARSEQRHENKPLLRWGIIVTALGIALTLGLLPIGFGSAGQTYPLGLGPWMLGGLVPLFLGLGLILMYYLAKNDS